MNDEVISGVYCLTNTNNGKCYIGSSKDILKRITQHFYLLQNETHTNKKLQMDYSNGDVIDWKIIKKCGSNLHKELFLQEYKAIKKYLKNGIKLYNTAKMNGDYYTSESQIEKRFADEYCKQHFGMPLACFFMRSKAEYNMLYDIHFNPDQEDELRDQYAREIEYQNMNNYYMMYYQKSYDEILEMEENERKAFLKHNKRRL